MRKICHILIGALAAASLMSGCASHAAKKERAQIGYEDVSPSLVTPSTGLRALAGPRIDQVGWEFVRNDPYLRAPVLTFGIAEVRHFETLRTTNARPREHTTTRSRSIRWIQAP
jgi:hypothetical protein